MVGDRYRIVTVQGNEEHVSSVVLGRSEVYHHLHMEESLHVITGWNVKRVVPRGDESPALLCMRELKLRRIFARKFSPLDDV